MQSPSVPAGFRRAVRPGPIASKARSGEVALATPAASATVVSTQTTLSFVIFCVYTFVLVGRPQDYIPALVPFRLVLVLTIVSCAVTRFRDMGHGRSWLAQPETKVYIFFFLAMCVGIPFSIYRRKSFEAVVLGYVTNVVFYVLFLIQVNTTAKYRRMVQVIMLAALVFSLNGILNGQFINGRFWTGSDMFDTNDVAFVEVSLLAFLLCVLLGSFGILWKLAALTGVLTSLLIILYTGSRGGFVALVTFLALFFLIRVPGVKKWHKFVMLIVLAATAYTNADKINVDRYLTLRDIGDDYNLHDEFGRAQIWQQGIEVFLDQPFTGVGVSGFSQSIAEKREEENLIAKWQAPHNSFIQVLTETGLFGVGPFVMLLVATGSSLFKSRRRKGAPSVLTLEMVPPLLFVGFISMLVNAMFLSQGYSVFFTLFLAAAVSFRRLVVPAETAQPAPPLLASPKPRWVKKR